MEKVYKESRDHHINQAVELALSHAHADWLKNDEMRQREIDQAVEVATTNAVAEAKEEWEREIKSQVCIKARTCSVVDKFLHYPPYPLGYFSSVKYQGFGGVFLNSEFEKQPHENSFGAF